MAPSVIVLGGGVAGMSAAHELAERGFAVTVYERQLTIPGGKARSVPVPGTGTEGRRPLPGEHGFRFFPGFYRHLPDTMARIPSGPGRTAADHLVPTEKAMMARFGEAGVVMLMYLPRSLADLRVMAHDVFGAHLGLAPGDTAFFADRLWQLMTSCYARRADDYERIGWWDYLDADHRSAAFQALFVNGLTRTLVAAKAKTASTKTGGDILLQLLFNMANPAVHTDRVLDGPTNDVWLDPWHAHLTGARDAGGLGVDYRFGQTVERIEVADGRVAAVWVRAEGGTAERYTADYYVAAVPVERMAALVSDELLAADPTLAGVRSLASSVAWMTGLQLYLTHDVRITQGHVIYTDSPWALTSISQPQFWPGVDLARYGDGTTRGILSVDISDWTTDGLAEGPADAAPNAEAVRDEVLRQLTRSLNVDGQTVLDPAWVTAFYLDRDIAFHALASHAGTGDGAPDPPDGTPGPGGDVPPDTDAEPLLVNRVNTWALRPEAYTAVSNLFLASDYVRTHTDLATMEGANEAARRAVNAILEASGSTAPRCAVWPLHEPLVLAPLRWLDGRRFAKGLPWTNEIPWVFRLLHWLWATAHRLLAARPAPPPPKAAPAPLPAPPAPAPPA